MLIQKNNEFLNFFTLRILHILEFYINLFIEFRNYNKINLRKFGYVIYSCRNFQNISFISHNFLNIFYSINLSKTQN